MTEQRSARPAFAYDAFAYGVAHTGEAAPRAGAAAETHGKGSPTDHERDSPGVTHGG